MRLDRIARVGQRDDLVGRDEGPAGLTGDLLFAVGEIETGEVTDVLAPDAEVGVDARGSKALAQASETPGPGGAVGGRPPLDVCGGGAGTRVGRAAARPGRRRDRRNGHDP